MGSTEPQDIAIGPRWGTFRDEFRPYRRDVWLTGGLAAVAAAAELVVVGILGVLGAAAFAGTDSPVGLPLGHYLSRTTLSVTLVVTVLMRGLLQLILASVQQRMLYRYEQQARTELLGAFLDAEWATQSSMESTDVYNAIFSFLNQARTALQCATDAVGSAVNFAFMVGGSFLIGGPWTFAIVGGSVLLAWALRPFIHASRKAAKDSREASRRFVAAMVETIALARESRLFGVNHRVKKRDGAASEAVADANRRSGLASKRLSVVYTTAVYAVAAAGLAAVILADVHNPAPYVTVVLLLYRGLGYGQALQSSYQTLISSEPAIEWLRQTRSELVENALPSGGSAFVPPLDAIQFSSVSFSYSDDVAAVEDLDFIIERGDAVGVVGPSGAGKSTLVQLLLRLRVPTRGEIHVNGQDITTLDPQSWFGHVVLVPQEARLANMSVLDNVLWFRHHLTRDDAIGALRSAHVLDEMLALPDGLETGVGEEGARLSGGQRQRLCIARALAAAPDVIILDEPTSALDLISEEAIRQTLAELHGRITLIIIAHRLSTLRVCDRVMVLRDGRMEAFADREDLERNNEFYAETLRLSRLV